MSRAMLIGSRGFLFGVGCGAFVALLTGCLNLNLNADAIADAMGVGMGWVARELRDNPKFAVAYIEPRSDSKVTGCAEFWENFQRVRVIVDVHGATPGLHGLHIHEKGDCSDPEANNAADHFNPTKASHGVPNLPSHHAGDLGNITVGADGNGRAELFSDMLTVMSGDKSVVNRSIVVDEKGDDMVSQPSGNSGARIGCGVITQNWRAIARVSWDGIQAPRLREILLHVRPLLRDWPNNRDALEQYGQRMTGLHVFGWRGWVNYVRKHGAGSIVSLYAEDPYAPPIQPPPVNPPRRRYRRHGEMSERHFFLSIDDLPLAQALALRPGQEVLINAMIAQADFARQEIDLTVTTLAPQPMPAIPPMSANDRKAMRLTLQRTTCFGRCPVYEASVEEDGTVTFTGHANVKVHGKQTATATPEQIRALLFAFERAGFFGLADSYMVHDSTDAPEVRLSLRRGNREKTIWHYHGDVMAPARLTILENQVDEILDTGLWIEP